VSSDDSPQFSFPTGAAHDAQVDLDPVRIRVLDRFGDPCANASCDVDTPVLGTRTRTLDDKGWLDIGCPKGTEYVDLDLGDGAEDAKRRVWLAPLSGDDSRETRRRLLNLGYGLSDNDGGGDGGAGATGDAGDGATKDDAGHIFLDDHGVDTGEDLAPHLDRIENDLKTLDSPGEQDMSLLTDQGVDTSDPGERT
jgi:hypothetical protein